MQWIYASLVAHLYLLYEDTRMRYSTLLYHYSTQATIIFLSSRRCAPLRTASSALGIELSVFSWWLLAEPPPPPPELPAFRHEACHSAAEPWPGRAGVVPDLPRGGINAPEPDPDDEEAIYTWEVWRPRPLWAAAPAYEAPEFLMHGHGGVPIPCWRELVTLRVRERLWGTPGPTEFDRLWRSVWGRLYRHGSCVATFERENTSETWSPGFDREDASASVRQRRPRGPRSAAAPCPAPPPRSRGPGSYHRVH